MFKTHQKIRTQEVLLSSIKDKNVRLFIKREDEIHPFVSGNKFRKLKYNIAKAKQQNKTTLLTFGGAFSNHIAATAVAGKETGFKTIGVIRGDELGVDIKKTLATNITLREAHQNGMQFKFVSRSVYRTKTSKEFIDQLEQEFGDFYLIPEGGTNDLAVQGCEEILTEDDAKFDFICCAIGTGGTISGLINSAANHQKIIGFPALKGDFLSEEIKKYTKQNNNWSLETDYHFGGFGKFNEALISFINQFKEETSIPLDPIYTGKMLFGLVDLIRKDYFSENSRILAVHTGGLQGVAGVNKRLKKKKQQLIRS